MKIKTDKKILCLIAIFLIFPLQSVAMFSQNSAKPVVINGAEANVDETDDLSEYLRENNAQHKKEYLMAAIKKCDWTAFEWTAVKEYLLAYMFDTDSSPLPSQYDLSMESQRYKVEFIEITKGFDGAKIINDIVAKITDTSSLTESQAFFLVFDAILNHLSDAFKHVHPNGCVVEQLSAKSSQYDGQPYTAKIYSKNYSNVKLDSIDKKLQELGLIADGRILSVTLVNTPNILAQLLQHNTGVEQPEATKTTRRCTAGVFINSYSQKYQGMVFVWLAGKRLDYELKPEGGFYQGEMLFRQLLCETMLGLHATSEFQPTLAVLAVDVFGFNYMNACTVKTVSSSRTKARVQSANLKFRSSDSMTEREIANLSKHGDIVTNITSIVRIAGLTGTQINAAKKNHPFDSDGACVQMLLEVSMYNEGNMIAVLGEALQSLELNAVLEHFKGLFYVSADE